MSPSLLQVEKLSVSMEGHRILSDVSLTVDAGEYVSVIGPNGAGKTTLIKCVAGILNHWTGTINLDGKPYTQYRPKERARIFAYVPQAEGRMTPLTVQEFTALGRYPHLSAFTTLTKADHRAIDAAIDCAGIEAIRHRALSTLSGGERQMAFIAAALAQEARLLLLDEPSTFLDYRHQAEVADLLKRVRTQQNIAVLAVHHDINTAVESSTRIHALKNGRELIHGRADQIADPATLERIYDTPFKSIPAPTRSTPYISTGGRP